MNTASAPQQNPKLVEAAMQRQACGIELPICRNAGGHGEARMESEGGTAFESLPRRETFGKRTLSSSSSVQQLNEKGGQR
jgi:hypothetical protein